jgi:hypothetical protein
MKISYKRKDGKQLSYKRGGAVSTEGYKRTSPDKDNAYNIIPSKHITMKEVDFPVMGIDDVGHMQMMMPGMEYMYPGNSVLEIPVKQKGGEAIPKIAYLRKDGIKVNR